MSERFEREHAIVVGTGSSKIGQSVESMLKDTFEVVATKQSGRGIERLDISNVDDIDAFIQNYIEEYGVKPVETLFLNSGVMNSGDTIHRGNFFKRANEGDLEITVHLNNVQLVEKMKGAGILNMNTKIIYNASIQILDPKDGYEDYALLKTMVSTLLLSPDYDTTILCASLVKGTNMEKSYATKLEANGKSLEDVVNKTMPDGQPTLEDFDWVVDYILAHKEQTKAKLIIVDGGSLASNRPDVIDDTCLIYSRGSDDLLTGEEYLRLKSS